MDEKFEGMEPLQELNILEGDPLADESVSETDEGLLQDEGLKDSEVDEILGNDWTEGEALSSDEPYYVDFKGKRRKRRGRREPLQKYERLERTDKGEWIERQDRLKKEEQGERQNDEGAFGRQDSSRSQGSIVSQGGAVTQNDDISQGGAVTQGGAVLRGEVVSQGGFRSQGSSEKDYGQRIEESGDRQWEHKKEGQSFLGSLEDPYEKWENREIREKDLHAVPREQGGTTYDSRQDQGIRNTRYEAWQDQGIRNTRYEAGQDQGIWDNRYEARQDQGDGNTRYGASQGQEAGDAKPEERMDSQTRYAVDKLTNYRSYQSLYDFYAYAGRRVFEKSAEKVRGQQGTVSEGLRELKDNKVVRFAGTLAAGHGAASLYKMMRYTENRVAEVAGKVGRYGLSPEVLKDKNALVKAMRDKKIIGVTRHDILKYRKSYLERAEVRELLRGDIAVHRSRYSRADRKFIESQDFMAAKNPDRYAGVLSKYFRQNGYAFAEGNRLLNIGYRDLEKIMHHADNYGFRSSMDQKLLSQLARVKKEKTLKIRAGGTLPGRLAGFLGMTVVEADPHLRDIAGRFSRGYAALRLKKEMTARVSRLIGREVRQSFLRRAGGGIHQYVVSPMIRHVVKPVIKKTGKGVIRSAGTVKKTVKTAGKSLAEKAAASSLGKSYSRGKRVVSSHVSGGREVIHNVGSRIARTPPVRFTKRAGIKTIGGIKAGAKAGRKAAGYSFKAVRGGAKAVYRTGFVLGTPLRFLGKVSAFLWQVRLKILMFAGGAVLGILAFLLVVFERILVLQLIVSILGFDFGSLFQNIGSNVLKVYENYIEYSDYKDMRDDLRMVKGLSDDTFGEALEIGNGVPEDDSVLSGRRISHYGSPDKDRGYTIHFLDPSGNELASRSNNVRDVEALCAAMIGNQMGEYVSYSRDLEAFDALLKDMYALMVPDISYEESEIYTCLYGCDTFSYHCNEPEDYDRYYELWEEGVGLYEDLVEYDSSKEECGGHSVPVCYGHKDVDIYITLFDVEYAISHNIYPENWRDRPYAKMVKEFIENGAWESEFYPMLARNFIGSDWHDAYGYDPDGGFGYSTQDVLSDEDIADILEQMGGDLSRARQEILEFALGSVGKIPYYWGGKADCWGYEGNDFGATVKTDRKNRDKKGLDCSGFVQWIYGSVLDVSVPGSTAGYAGYRQESYSELQVGDIGFLNPPGAESNHMGIYAGKDDSGNDLWIHCSSSKGSTYGTYSFKYFCNVFH